MPVVLEEGTQSAGAAVHVAGWRPFGSLVELTRLFHLVPSVQPPDAAVKFQAVVSRLLEAVCSQTSTAFSATAAAASGSGSATASGNGTNGSELAGHQVCWCSVGCATVVQPYCSLRSYRVLRLAASSACQHGVFAVQLKS